MIAALPLFAVSSHKLVALDDTGLESFFHSWRGASGRRYICSVYDIDEAPQFDLARAVVAAVRRNAAGTEITFTFQPAADGSDWRDWAAKARRAGASEFHVHLLAGEKAQRDFIARDLTPALRRAA